ncbi:MAG: dTMP kinase [Clostridia bacterium]
MNKGIFITFEGTEGVGKSTQVKLLGEYLEKTNQPHIVTREPGGDMIAEKIRAIVLGAENENMAYETEALLYAASRAQHCKNVVIPALNEGKIVVCDRFVDSSIIYQAYGRGLSIEFVKNINEYALRTCPPNLTVLLDMPPEEAFKRKGGADVGDRIEMSGKEFFNRVNDAYQYLKNDVQRVAVINPCGTKFETSEKIIELLKSKNLIK